jgi:hypothetical protein
MPSLMFTDGYVRNSGTKAQPPAFTGVLSRRVFLS